jgi:hypothetical protein
MFSRALRNSIVCFEQAHTLSCGADPNPELEFDWMYARQKLVYQKVWLELSSIVYCIHVHMPVLEALLLQLAGLCMRCESKMMGHRFREHMESCPAVIAFCKSHDMLSMQTPAKGNGTSWSQSHISSTHM